MPFSQQLKTQADIKVNAHQRLFATRGDSSMVFINMGRVTEVRQIRGMDCLAQSEDHGMVTLIGVYREGELEQPFAGLGHYKILSLKADPSTFFSRLEEKIEGLIRKGLLQEIDKVSVSESYGNLTAVIGYWEGALKPE